MTMYGEIETPGYIKIPKNFKTLDRFQAVRGIELEYVTVPLKVARPLVDIIYNKKSKTRALKKLEEAQEQTEILLENTQEQIALITDMMRMLTKVDIKKETECYV